MTGEKADLNRVVVKRIFVIQFALIVTMLSLLLVGDAMNAERFGFDFWLAFFAGCMGSSIALLKRIRTDEAVLSEAGRSVIDTVIPVLYGAILAGLAYALFLSGILSGPTGEGLLTTNLFPTFRFAAEGAEAESLVRSFLRSRPASVPDLGKLLVWCFLAGYSEKFVVGILGQLDARTEPNTASTPGNRAALAVSK